MKNSGIPKPILKEIIATPQDFKPSSPEMKIIGVFNPGITTIKKQGKEKTVLMLRISETPLEDLEEVKLPYFPVDNKDNSEFEIKYDKVRKEDCKVGKKEVHLWNRTERLKHISYQLIFFSEDGINIDYENPVSKLHPCYEHERFGIEDCRITKIDDSYVFSYVCPHRESSVSTCFAVTQDFKTFKRFPIENNPEPIIIGVKDVALFPEKIPYPHSKNNAHAVLIRPNAFASISKPRIWIRYFGVEEKNLPPIPHDHLLIEPEEKGDYVGTGSPLVKIRDKWVGTYHEVYEEDSQKKYKTKLVALDIDEPWNAKKVITSKVLIEPHEFDMEPGYVPNVVYSSGFVVRQEQGVADIYSGEDDSYTSIRRYYLEDLVKFLTEERRTI